MSALKKEIIQHWKSFKNPLINDILINLEKIEGKLSPITEDETYALDKLIKQLKDIKPDDVDEMQFIHLLNEMPAAYMLYIIHKLQTINTDLVMKVIGYAQDHRSNNPDVEKFFQRNMVFEKSQLLGRIFSNIRMQNVLDALTEGKFDSPEDDNKQKADNKKKKA
jgi:hypothetical protein